MMLRTSLYAGTTFKVALTVILAAFVVVYAPLKEAVAGQNGVALELNGARTLRGACIGSFVIKNGLGHTLDRFQLDLFVFGDDGVIKHRSNIDLAPLRANKTTVISFRLLPAPCAEVSRILVNDIPLCRSEDGLARDCLKGLVVSSRSQIKLSK
jgi:hypothetical protein